MKVFVAVAVIAAFCAVQIECASNDLLDEIAFQKDRVSMENARLERFGENYVSDVGRTMESATGNSVRNINTLLRRTAERIETAVNEATAEGKDAASCLESAGISASQLSLRTTTVLNKTRDDAVDSAKEIKKEIDNAVDAGNRLINTLETIILERLSDDVEKTEESLIGDKSEVYELIRSYFDESERVTRVAKSEAVNAYSSALETSEEIFQTARQDAAGIVVSATECIAAL